VPRFVFHVRNGSTFKDKEGQNSRLETARVHAAKLPFERPGLQGCAVVVTDEQARMK
jgi:hypothetical protein